MMLALGEISVTDKISAYAAAEPVAPIKGSNSNGVVADKAQGEAQAAGAAASKTGDTVTLTNSARSLQKIEEAVAKAPVVNASKVAAVEQSIKFRTHQVNDHPVAPKMLPVEPAPAATHV